MRTGAGDTTQDSAHASKRQGDVVVTQDDTRVAEFAEAALTWAVDHLAEFHPLQDGVAFEVVRGQRMSELATMAYCHVQLGGDCDGPAMSQVLNFLDLLQRDRRLADRVLRMPAEFVLFSDVYGSMRCLGREDPVLGQLLRRALAAGLPVQMERPPHRLMDVGLTLELGRLQSDWPTMESLYPQSIAARVHAAHKLDEAAVYALTHVIMFLFGFGTRESDAVTPADRTRLAGVLSDLIVCMCQERHWDLLTELLICWDCLDLAPTQLTRRAWSTLVSQQRSDGAVPGPVQALRLYEASGRHPDPETDPALDFAYHYHTTLLAIIAGTLRRNRAARPAAPAPQKSSAPVGSGDDVEIKPVFAGALAWLTETLDVVNSGPTVSPASLCAIVVGVHICSCMLPATPQPIDAILGRCAQQMNQLAADDPSSFDSVPATMRLLAGAVLGRHGIGVSPLHRYMLATLRVLRDAPAMTPHQQLELADKHALISRLGLVSPPPALQQTSVTDVAAVVNGFALDVPAKAADELLLHLNAYTGHGDPAQAIQGHGPGGIAVADAVDLVHGLVQHALRQYDLAGAASLIRTLGYLEDRITTGTRPNLALAAAQALALQQRPDGCFGFFGPSEDDARAKLTPGDSLRSALYLPVTTECLWTIAERARPGWRLFDSLRP